MTGRAWRAKLVAMETADLLNTDKIRTLFERDVVGDAEAEIDQAIDELIDWMVEQDLKTWKAVTDYIDRRRLAILLP